MNKKLGKNVNLVFEGEQTEVDKSVADMLGDPLMHLVRNAVDHGIEPPEERAAAGKTEQPTVTLKAYYESNDVLISVTDNGAGMDAHALLEKARSKGILTKPEQEYTEQDCFALIMAAGFSTNTQITEYSGRGVGMDVVKKNLEKVGGTLLVDSVFGKGSVFTIRVPMSLSISDCMAIRLGGQEYALPVSAMTEAFRAKPEQIIVTPDGKEMVLRDRLYKIIRLSEHFGLHDCESDCARGIMLLCTSPHGDAALFADEIIEEMQIVIKPFSAYLSRFGLKESGFSGTSVLGDGSIIPVIDVNEVIKRGLAN
jgi:two-component system chemotaxis sensor kinase CheA